MDAMSEMDSALIDRWVESRDAELRTLYEGVLDDREVLIEISNLPYHEWRELDTESMFTGNPISQMLFPAQARVTTALAWDDAENRGTLLMAGLELYRSENGSYPDSLDQLAPEILSDVPTDPFTGESFSYALTDAGYSLHTATDWIPDHSNLFTWSAEKGRVIQLQ